MTQETKTKQISKWWRRYRVMPDAYSGYQVEIWYIWFPFWHQIGFTNTFRSLEDATTYAEMHANPIKL